ncbi:MAG: metal-dependent hydrolase [Bacteroidetes bacterium]|nr:MAG: metal-dependent hydrolase [Bacteroidota bacterium]
MEITYYGHSCFQITVDENKILFDPFITPNPLAIGISITEINPDFVLITHGHGDHLADAEAILKQSGAMLIANFEVVTWFQNKGIENAHPMNQGGSKEFDFGSVKVVNAVHSSSMPDGSYGGNPVGFVLNCLGQSLYYAGDTALHQDMKQIKEEFNLNFALLPIGDNFTMGIDDALITASYVGTDKVIGMHYDTFPYIEIDHQTALDKASVAGIDLTLPVIGQTFNI